MDKQSKIPIDFDPEIYLELNPDVRAAGFDPIKHYLEFGHNERRVYRLADPVCGIASDKDEQLHKSPNTKRSTICKHTNIWEWIRSVGNKKDFRVLEIGSRSVVSDSLWKQFIPDCSYTGFDVLHGKNVDVVGDAHRLTEYFEPNSFDLVISFAVFEHLAMPWIVAEEISNLLDRNGFVCIETHFSFSEHELPWHYFQFNSQALEVLFCKELGFEIIDSGLDNPIVGRFSYHSAEYLRGRLVPDLYCHSSIIARKTGAELLREGNSFDWRAVARRISGESMYPSR